MAVIVNELEVVVEPPTSAVGQAPRAGEGEVEPTTQALSPADLESVLRHSAGRRARVWAH